MFWKFSVKLLKSNQYYRIFKADTNTDVRDLKIRYSDIFFFQRHET